MPGPLSSLGGGGGLPSGPLGPINVGSLISAATLPPGIQFLQGLATLPDAFNKANFDASQAQEERLKSKTLQMQIAQNQWDQSVAMIQKNPDLAGTPAMIRKMQGLSADTGYMLPLDSQGRIDTSVWGTSLTDFIKDKDLAQRWFAADKPGKETLARLYHLTGITNDDYNAAPVRTAQEQNLFDKFGIDKEKADAYVKNTTAYTAARVGNYTAMNAVDAARAKNLYETGQAALLRAKSYGDDIQNKLTIAREKNATALQVAQTRADAGGQISYRSSLRASEQAVRQATELYNKLKADVGTAIQNGASPDDPDVQAIQAQAAQAQKGIDAANIQLQDAQARGPEMQRQAQSTNVTRQSGKPSATVTNANQGRAYIVQPGTGKVFYKYPDGTYDTTPPPQ